jgi:intracellular sulfur oxidation DsrE/DsrF family protein
MMLKNLISKGVNVEVCPPYLPNANKSSTDLIQGVRIADPSLVTDKILDKNTQILSY